MSGFSFRWILVVFVGTLYVFLQARLHLSGIAAHATRGQEGLLRHSTTSEHVASSVETNSPSPKDTGENPIIYSKWKTPYSWCQPEMPGRKNVSRFLFLKTFKTGSSTAAAVHLQIARNIGRRVLSVNNTSCANDWKHLFGRRRRHALRDPINSFLWTIVRDPVERALSAYHFYRLGKNREDFSTDSLIQHLNQSRNHQLEHLQVNSMRNRPLASKHGVFASHSLPSDMRKEDYQRVIGADIFPKYSFIAVADRMDESLVVLKILLNLEHKDIIVFSSKAASHGYSYDWSKPGFCFKIPPKPSKLPMPVLEYIQGDFLNRNGDVLLLDEVNRKLNRTIHALGFELVQKELVQHRRLKAWVQERCANETIFPCSSSRGKFQAAAEKNCLFRDLGCGFKCIDEALSKWQQDRL